MNELVLETVVRYVLRLFSQLGFVLDRIDFPSQICVQVSQQCISGKIFHNNMTAIISVSF